METDYLLLVYAIYAAASLGLTIWLAQVLGKNGAVFLEDVFADKPRLGEAINRLLVVGFYLGNLGWALSTMIAYQPATLTGAFEVLSKKLGTLLLCLAAMHFANLYVFHRIRRRMNGAALPPPVPPQLHVDMVGQRA